MNETQKQVLGDFVERLKQGLSDAIDKAAEKATRSPEEGAVKIVTLDGKSFVLAQLSENLPPNEPFDVDVVIKPAEDTGSRSCTGQSCGAACDCLGQVSCRRLRF